MGFLSPDIDSPPPPPPPALAPTYASTDVQGGSDSAAQKRAKAAAGLSGVTNEKRDAVGSTTTAQKQLVGE